ncbi:inositol monophosphatase family protein [Demequina sediminicola]|uniref:inositol monophosphatase family protein n=1 Tax=Demequina sediminicola TaxID=1095026 RepID=UPI00078044C7|nr:inositol monophosphatase family protein [Demequina sediminicola]
MTSDAVSPLMRSIADEYIRPRFRALTEGQISTKEGPGDLVTIADVEAERAITPLLQEIEDIPVVGEEATADDPALPDLLADAPAAWTVDPVDGTWNFAHGRDDYAVMVAHVLNGDPHAGWILHPETGQLVDGVVGGGAQVTGADGVARELSAPTGPVRALNKLHGMAVTRFTPPGLKEQVEAMTAQLGTHTEPRMCAGWDYWDLLTGEVDFLLYSRAKPWDHAPGAAICIAAGFEVRYIDNGEPYRPGLPGRPFLVTRPGEFDVITDGLNSASSNTGA